jgi:hypothetical protein
MPKYDLEKIRFATDAPTFQKAAALYESGKIHNFQFAGAGYTATVLGSSPYQVYVSDRSYDQGSCTCYLGQNDTLCKHMVAVAIWAVTKGKRMSEEDKQTASEPVSSGKIGILSKQDLLAIKKSITEGMRYIKSYSGPSRIWFAYQNSLDEGCARLSEIVSKLPVSPQTAEILLDMLLRLDAKLSSSGVDDSNGTVGGFMEGVVKILLEFARLDSRCKLSFRKLKGKETSFGWEDPLLAQFNT